MGAVSACGEADDFATVENGLSAEEVAGDNPECTHPHPDLSAADTDGDGEISEEEARAFVAARRAALLATFDADGDGHLDREERAAAREAFRAAYFAELDVDGSGNLSEAEVADTCALAAAFERVDTDGDGLISEAEFLDAEWPRARHARRALRHARRHHGGR